MHEVPNSEIQAKLIESVQNEMRESSLMIKAIKINSDQMNT